MAPDGESYTKSSLYVYAAQCPSITYSLLDSKYTSIGLSDVLRVVVEFVFKLMYIISRMCIHLFSF